MTETIWEKVLSGSRLSSNEGLFLLSEAPMNTLSEMSSLIKERLWGNQVTFVLDTNPNYTNVCNCHCRFCAFFRDSESHDSFTLTEKQVVERVSKAVQAGATTVLMQGGCNPDLPLDYYLDMVKALKKAFPEVHLHLFSPPEIISMADSGNIPITEVLKKLRDLGLTSLPGGGAEILVEKIRREVSPRKCSAREWLDVMYEAHKLGFKSTATMVFGLGESDADEIAHLEALRDLQDRTNGFTAFIPWSFKPGNTDLPFPTNFIPGIKYLRLLATARLFLDNFPHIQASWFSQGKRTGQLGLLFGADDFGGTLFEEHVLKTTGHKVNSGVDEVKTLIRGAGMVPARRTTLYKILEVFNP